MPAEGDGGVAALVGSVEVGGSGFGGVAAHGAGGDAGLFGGLAGGEATSGVGHGWIVPAGTYVGG